MLNPPLDDGCQPDPDPRLSPEEAVRIAGEQYTGKPYVPPTVDDLASARYVLSIDERPGHERVELWAGPHKLTDQHARRVLATAMRRMMP